MFFNRVASYIVVIKQSEFPLQAEVQPRCGRVVGFGAGKDNPHGVRAVTKGQRCAVALWFTLDPAHEEKVNDIGGVESGQLKTK